MNLHDFINQCSENYHKMHVLLQAVHHQSDLLTWEIGTVKYQMRFVKKAKFTDVISLACKSNHSLSWLTNIDCEIKIYHDAKLVEVSGLKNLQGTMQQFSHKQAQKNYPYWEKWQINTLLSDILTLCIAQKEKLIITQYRP